MGFPRYEKYKNSGVEWLGEVPEHWVCHYKLNDMAQAKRNSFVNGPFGSDLLTTELIQDGVPVIYIRDLKPTGYVRVSEWCVSEEKANQLNFCNVVPGDILVAKVGTPPGLAVLYPEGEPNGIVTQDVIRIRVCENIVDQLFLIYILNSNYGRASIDNISVESTRTRISLGEYKQLRIVLPPKLEQSQIAIFLDRETAKIDDLIAEQQKLIELLKEKRQAVISHAVTKGLNPDAKMKDSGNEWLGEVPEGWDVKKIKHIKSLKANSFVDGPFGSNLKSEHFIDNGDVYVIESNFATQGLIDSDNLKTISFKHFETIKRSETTAGDIIIAKIGAQFGKSSILPKLDKRSVVSGNSLKLTVDNSICNVNFINWQLINLKQLGAIDDIVNGTAQPALSLAEMNNIPIVLPSLDEQQTIVEQLISELIIFDGLNSEAQKAITLLQERRTALISAAVTGKIDVRGFVSDSESVVAA